MISKEDVMKQFSKVFLLSAVSLFVDSGNLTYASFEDDSSLLKSGIPTLHIHHTYIRHTLHGLDLSSRLFDERMNKGVQIASVCFITDAGNCDGHKLNNNDDYTNPEDLCKQAGYTDEPCPEGSYPTDYCPYDSSYHGGCSCSSDYDKVCDNSIGEYGVGDSCGGKYKDCCYTCEDYAYDTIPADYVSNGECDSCDGKRYKIKCDPSKFMDEDACGSQEGTGATCTDDEGTHYERCNCPNNYEWSETQQECVCASSFKYSCTRTGYAGGEGYSCDNKYAKCKCETGYVWNAEQGACVCEGTDWCAINQNCEVLGYSKGICGDKHIKCVFDSNYTNCGGETGCSVGDILNNDMSCSKEVVNGKTPIAVVVYVDSEGHGQATALEDLGQYFQWSTNYNQTPQFLAGKTDSEAILDIASCENTEALLLESEMNGGGMYPAAEAAHNYAPAAAPSTKGKWCLPARGIALRIGDDIYVQDTLQALNISLYYGPWSSTYSANGCVWDGYFNCMGGRNSTKVIPVIEF